MYVKWFPMLSLGWIIVNSNGGAFRKLSTTPKCLRNWKSLKKLPNQAAAKLAKTEGLAIAISEEAATRNELDKLSANVFAWRQKVEEAENELVDIEKNVSFCNQQQQKKCF